MINDFTGPLACVPFNWTAQEQKEPFYFKDDSNITPNNDSTPIWVRYSPDCYMDFSDTRILSLKFGQGTELTGVLIMMKPNESILVTGGASANQAVTFQIPTGSLVFQAFQGVFNGSSSPFKNASTQKTISEISTSNSMLIPAGTDVPSSSTFALQSLSAGILKTTLSAKAFITSNNILRCKFAHIIVGASHCYIRNMACDANC